MMECLRIEPHYLPSIEYMSLLNNCKQVELDVNSLYKKQTLRNRTDILGPNNTIALSVPVKQSLADRNLKDMQISYAEDWQKQHWRSIESSYGRSPYFEYYADYLKPHYKHKYKYLVDLTVELLTLCLKLTSINVKMTVSDDSNPVQESEFVNLISQISARKGHEQRGYYSTKPYQQVFGSDFVANLSIIDLLFCTGPESKQYLNYNK